MRASNLYRQYHSYARTALSFFHQSATVPSGRLFSTAQPIVSKQQQLKEFKPYAEQTMLHDVVETRIAHQRFLNELKVHILQAYRSSSLFQLRHSEPHPTVFISYAWCLENLYPWEWWTQPFLVRFAMDLYQLGFDPRLDIMHSRFGPSSIEYMMRELDRADLVFPIGTRSLNTKMVGDEYFQSAIRYEMRMISERKVRCAKSGQTDGVMPLQLTGDDVALVFPSNYPQHTVIESFQQPNTSYLMMLCELVKYAYHHFSGTPKLDITKAMTNSETEDGGGRLCSLIESTKVTSALSTHFYRLSDEAVQRYHESYTSETATVKQQWLHSTTLFIEQSQQVKPLSANDGYFKKPPAAVSLHLQMGQDTPYSRLTHQSALKVKSWCYEVPELYDSFVPRSSYFGQLAERLHDRSSKTGSTIVVLHGLGGVGKTQLASYALTHAEAFGQRSSYPLKAWFRAGSAEQLQMSYIQFAEEFGIPLDGKQSLIERAIIVREWLEAFEGGFLVYDNVSEEKQIAELLPSKGRYQIVVTSRNAHWSLGSSIAIDVMSAREAEQLVIQVCRYPEVTEDVTILVKLLGYLPLALMQAAAYIRATDCSVAHYLALYHQYQAEMLSEMTEEGWPRGVEYCGAEGNPQPVWTTFNINFTALQEKEPGALQLLEHCAYLHHQAIPVELLQGLVLKLEEGKQPTKSAPLQVDKYIRALRKYSLVQTESSINTINVHQLVQEILRHHLGKLKNFLGCIIALNQLLTFKFAKKDELKRNHARYRLLLSHAVYLIDYQENYMRGQQDLAILSSSVDLYFNLGDTLCFFGDSKKAIGYFKRALIFRQHIFGESHIETAPTLMNIGNCYRALGDLQKARAYIEDALSIYKKSGVEDASGLNNLGLVLEESGDLKQARECLECALKLHEARYGEKDIKLAEILSNLGMLLRKLGELNVARKLLERSLAIEQEVYGENYIETAATLSNLGDVLRGVDEYELAKKYYEKSLYLKYNFYGKSHIQTARTMNNLGGVLVSMGEFEQAQFYLDSAQEVFVSHYGDGHIQIAGCLANLASLFNSLGDYHRAKIHAARALTIQEKSFKEGGGDVFMVYALFQLAKAHEQLGELAVAKNYYERALIVMQTNISDSHISMIDILDKLTAIMTKLGDNAQAKIYFLKGLDIKINNLDEIQLNNEKLAAAIELAEQLMVLKEFQSASRLYHIILKTQDKIYSKTDLGLIKSLINLSATLIFLGEYVLAKDNLLRASFLIRGSQHSRDDYFLFLSRAISENIIIVNDYLSRNEKPKAHQREAVFVFSKTAMHNHGNSSSNPQFPGRCYYSTSSRSLRQHSLLRYEGMFFGEEVKPARMSMSQKGPLQGCRIVLTKG